MKRGCLSETLFTARLFWLTYHDAISGSLAFRSTG